MKEKKERITEERTRGTREGGREGERRRGGHEEKKGESPEGEWMRWGNLCVSS